MGKNQDVPRECDACSSTEIKAAQASRNAFLAIILIHYPMLRYTLSLLIALSATLTWAQSPAAVGKALTAQLNKTVYLTSSQKTQVEPIFTKAMMKIGRIQATDEADYQRQREELLTRMDGFLNGILSDTQSYRYKKARQAGTFKFPSMGRRQQTAAQPTTVSRTGTTMQAQQPRQQAQQRQTVPQPQPQVQQPAQMQVPATTPPLGQGLSEAGTETSEGEETWEEESYEEESYEEDSWEDDGTGEESYDTISDSLPQQHMLLKSSDFVVDEVLDLRVPTDSAALDSMGKGKIILKKAGRFIYDEVVKPSVEKKIEQKQAEKAKAKEGEGGS